MDWHVLRSVRNHLRVVGKIVVHCCCGFDRTDPIKADSRFRFGTLGGRGFGYSSRVVEAGRFVGFGRPCTLPPVEGAH